MFCANPFLNSSGDGTSQDDFVGADSLQARFQIAERHFPLADVTTQLVHLHHLEFDGQNYKKIPIRFQVAVFFLSLPRRTSNQTYANGIKMKRIFLKM